jgi:hypothetical protein
LGGGGLLGGAGRLNRRTGMRTMSTTKLTTPTGEGGGMFRFSPFFFAVVEVGGCRRGIWVSLKRILFYSRVKKKY